MTKDEIAIVLEKHVKWLRGEPSGERANRRRTRQLQHRRRDPMPRVERRHSDRMCAWDPLLHHEARGNRI